MTARHSKNFNKLGFQKVFLAPSVDSSQPSRQQSYKQLKDKFSIPCRFTTSQKQQETIVPPPSNSGSPIPVTLNESKVDYYANTSNGG